MAQQEFVPHRGVEENVLPFAVSARLAHWIAESPQAFSVGLELQKLHSEPYEPVILHGERGVGKSLIAAEIHFGRRPSCAPWIEIDAATLVPDGVAAEIFGIQVQQSATGETRVQPGLIDRAAGGTLHIRNADTLPRTVQRTLAGLLQTGEYLRIGAQRSTGITVRLVLSSLLDLAIEARSGRFSIALNALIPKRLQVPPLRSRRGDCPALIQAIVEQLNQELSRKCRGVTPRAMARLLAYDWPGNVRELHGVLERALLLSDIETIDVTDLPREITGGTDLGEGFEVPLGRLTLEQMEIYTLRAALDATGENQVQAARLLGLSRDTLRYRMKKFGMIKQV